MTVEAHDFGTFLVSSESRPGMQHLVDLQYREEPRSKPRGMCSCEVMQAKGLPYCKHLEFVVEQERKRLGL